MGEILVEIMRPQPDMPLGMPGEFHGPYPSGAPAIFADTVARLGKPAGIIGGVGDDAFGRMVLERLQDDGVDTRLVSIAANASTAVAFVAYDSAGERDFIFHIKGTPAVAACSLVGDIAAFGISKPLPGFFHVMGCSLMSDEDFCREIYKTAGLFRSIGARVSFDPNIRPELLGGLSLGALVAPIIEICSVLLPGHDELLAISGMDTVETAALELFKNPCLEVIALKLGGNGCRIITRDEDFSIGVYEVEVIDPTGASDCFDAGFLCGMLDGLSLQDCAKQASAAAALNTAAFGPMEGNISPKNIQKLRLQS